MPRIKSCISDNQSVNCLLFFLKFYVIYTATKKAAERAYKDLQRNAGKQQDRTKLSKNDAAGKNPKTPKKKCEKRDEKAIQQQIQRRQMQETLSKMQDTPNCSATGFTPAPVAKRIGIFSDDDDNPCCKVSFDTVKVSRKYPKPCVKCRTN